MNRSNPALASEPADLVETSDLETEATATGDAPIRFHWADALLCLLVSWGLFGHQLMVLIAVRLQLPTRDLTVASRGLTTGLALLTLALAVLRPDHLFRRISVVLLTAFWGCYLLRIALEAEAQAHVAHFSNRLPLSYIAQMAIGACLLPSLALLCNTSWNWHRVIRRTCLVLVCSSGVLMLVTYGSHISNFDVRWRSGSELDGFFAIHPLALGHLGADLIGVAMCYFCCLHRGGQPWQWLIGTLLCALGVPLVVGSASRGPIVALAATACFLLAALTRRGAVGRAFAVVSAAAVIVVAILAYTSHTGSNLVGRLLNIKDGIASQSSDTDRLELYGEAISIFLDAPLMGSSTKLPGRDEYPHNLFIESLMATGLAGTIPFLALVAAAFHAAWRIMIQRPELTWVPVLFFLHFAAGMLSFAIYTNTSFWISMAATLSCGEWVRRQTLAEAGESR